MAAAQRNAAAGDGMGTRLFRGVCYFAGAHPDVALESNRFDQATIAFQAFALTLATVLAVVAWGASFATFLPVLPGFARTERRRYCGRDDWRPGGAPVDTTSRVSGGDGRVPPG